MSHVVTVLCYGVESQAGFYKVYTHLVANAQEISGNSNSGQREPG